METPRTQRPPRAGTFTTADEVARDIVDSALKEHRALGPGLLESAYQACLAHELQRRGHLVECEVTLPVEFEGMLIEVAYRIDMQIDQLVLVENKTVEKILPIHLAKLLTYLKLSGFSLGLISTGTSFCYGTASSGWSETIRTNLRTSRAKAPPPQFSYSFLACLALLAFRSYRKRPGNLIKLVPMGT